MSNILKYRDAKINLALLIAIIIAIVLLLSSCGLSKRTQLTAGNYLVQKVEGHKVWLQGVARPLTVKTDTLRPGHTITIVTMQ